MPLQIGVQCLIRYLSSPIVKRDRTRQTFRRSLSDQLAAAPDCAAAIISNRFSVFTAIPRQNNLQATFSLFGSRPVSKPCVSAGTRRRGSFTACRGIGRQRNFAARSTVSGQRAKSKIKCSPGICVFVSTKPPCYLPLPREHCVSFKIQGGKACPDLLWFSYCLRAL